MKRSYGILASAIATVVMLGACQKEQVNSQDNGSEQKVAELFGTFTVKADYTEPVAEASTKTALVDVDNPYVKWLSTDKINMWEFVDGKENACFQTVQDGTHLGDNDKSATFDISLNGTDPAGSTYCYTAIYPDGAVTKNGEIYSFEVPATQTLVNGNFAANADILIGKPVTQASRISSGYSINVQFKRPGTAVKLTLKGITAGDLISSVKITAPEGQKIAGRCKIDLTTGEVSDKAYENGTNEITLNCGNATATGNDVFYFRCLDGTWESGSSVSIEVKTGVALYTKTVSLPKDYVFADGGLTKFGFQGMTKKDYKAEAMDYIRKIAADAISKIKNMDVSYDVTGRAEVNINQVVLDAELSIESSTSKAEIDEAKEVAEKTIQWIIVDVENKYSKELDEAKDEAIADVDKVAHEAKSKIDGFNVTDYVKDEAKNNIDNVVAEAGAAIASATSKNRINEAKNNAIDKIKIEVERIRPTS